MTAPAIWRGPGRVPLITSCTVLVFAVAICVLATLDPAWSGQCGRCEVSLVECSYSWQSADYHAQACRTDLDRARKTYASTLADREATWEGLYDSVRQEKAGAACWQRVQDLEQESADRLRMCLWRLKSAGCTDREAAREVRAVEEGLLTEDEEDELDN